MKKILIVLSIFTTTNAIAQLPSYVPTAGLQAWFPFDSTTSNVSGNLLQTVESGFYYTQDKNNTPSNAILFMNNAWMDIYNVNLNPANDFSLSFNLRVLNFANYTVLLDMNYSNFCNGDFEIWTINNNVGIAGCNFATPTYSLVDNFNALNWHKFVIVSKDDTTSIYRDCEFITKFPKAWPSAPQVDITLGNASNIGHMHNQGSDVIYDNFGVWNRALTRREITDLCRERTVGVNDIKTKEVAVIFLEAQNLLRITPGTGLNNTPYAILSTTGQLITSGTLNSATVEVDMSGYASGMYIVRFPSNTTYFKFIKH